MPRIHSKDYREVDIHRKLIALLKAAKVSQKDLAALWDISQGRVSQKLKTNDISLKELIEIIDLTHAEPEEITRLLKR